MSKPNRRNSGRQPTTPPKTKETAKNYPSQYSIPHKGYYILGGLVTAAILSVGLLYNPFKKEEAILISEPTLIESAKEIEYPTNLNQTGITVEQLRQIKGVKEIKSYHGERPDVIFLAQYHTPGQELLPENLRSATAPPIESICHELYEQYRINSIAVEGITEALKLAYLKSRVLSERNKIADINNAILANQFDFYNGIFGNPTEGWNIYVGESDSNMSRLMEIISPIKKIQDKVKKDIDDKFLKWANDQYRNNKYSMNASGNVVFTDDPDKAYDAILSESQNRGEEEIEKLLTPKVVEILYDIHFIQREKAYAESAVNCKKEGKNPMILVLGATHIWSISHVFEKEGLNYAIVLPEGLSETTIFGGNEREVISQMYERFTHGGRSTKYLDITPEETLRYSDK